MNLKPFLLFLFIISFSITDSIAKHNKHDRGPKHYKKLYYALKLESNRRAEEDAHLQSQIEASQEKLEQSQQHIANLNEQLVAVQLALSNAQNQLENQGQLAEQLQQTVAGFTSIIEAQNQSIDALNQQLAALDLEGLKNRVEVVENNSVLELDGYLKLHPEKGDTALFQGINVQIVNHAMATDTVDGTGNLILGFNEASPASRPYCSQIEITNEEACLEVGAVWSANKRLGSHNLVLGRWNDYISYGGIVGGELNLIAGASSMAMGGLLNTAQGEYSSILGGSGNTAVGIAATISGGEANRAQGILSTIGGGFNNQTTGNLSTIGGGINLETTRATEWKAGSAFALE